MVGAQAYVPEGFLPGAPTKWVGLRVRIVDGAEDEVEYEEHGYKQGLSDGRGDA